MPSLQLTPSEEISARLRDAFLNTKNVTFFEALFECNFFRHFSTVLSLFNQDTPNIAWIKARLAQLYQELDTRKQAGKTIDGQRLFNSLFAVYVVGLAFHVEDEYGLQPSAAAQPLSMQAAAFITQPHPYGIEPAKTIEINGQRYDFRATNFHLAPLPQAATLTPEKRILYRIQAESGETASQADKLKRMFSKLPINRTYNHNLQRTIHQEFDRLKADLGCQGASVQFPSAQETAASAFQPPRRPAWQRAHHPSETRNPRSVQRELFGKSQPIDLTTSTGAQAYPQQQGTPGLLRTTHAENKMGFWQKPKKQTAAPESARFQYTQ